MKGGGRSEILFATFAWVPPHPQTGHPPSEKPKHRAEKIAESFLFLAARAVSDHSTCLSHSFELGIHLASDIRVGGFDIRCAFVKPSIHAGSNDVL